MIVIRLAILLIVFHNFKNASAANWIIIADLQVLYSSLSLPYLVRENTRDGSSLFLEEDDIELKIMVTLLP